MLSNVLKLSFEKQAKNYERNGLGDNGREVQVKLLRIGLINYDILYVFFLPKNSSLAADIDQINTTEPCKRILMQGSASVGGNQGIFRIPTRTLVYTLT